MNFVLAQRKVI